MGLYARWRERVALWIAPSLNRRLSDWRPKRRAEYELREWNALTQDQRNRVVRADPSEGFGTPVTRLEDRDE